MTDDPKPQRDLAAAQAVLRKFALKGREAFLAEGKTEAEIDAEIAEALRVTAKPTNAR